MKKLVIVLVVLIAVVLIVYRSKVVIERARLQETKIEERITAVEVELVRKGSVTLSLDFVGDVKGEEEVDIFPKASGKLLDLKVKEGDRVKRDQVVALVDRDVNGVRFEPLEVTSPMDGIVGMVYLDQGAEVSPPSPGPSMGTALMKVVEMDQVKVVVNVTEEDLGKMKSGQKASVRVDTYPDKVFSGKVSLISPMVSQRTRTAPVEINLQNPKHLLKPGMFAEVKIDLGRKEDILLIPAHAIVEETGEKQVFLVSGGKVVSRSVETGVSQDGWIEIQDELAEGDSLIVTGQYLVRDGESVKVVSRKGGRQ
ncbi:MAG: efflux RND transporter periplasmic adaptor subunit [Candidatus Zixiibacteriota bacterium]|nr:MAG: efflux RND transporter periplasmic adaptor subunit [candidate division Zixibacteria bacterium]